MTEADVRDDTPAARLAAIAARIARAERIAQRPAGSVTLVAVSKTFPAEDVAALIACGQRVFGENRVQEAKAKFRRCGRPMPISNCT